MSTYEDYPAGEGFEHPDLDALGMGRLIVVSGVQAAGKTTVGAGLASALPRAIHVDGDAIHQFVVSGGAEYDEPPTPEALEQLLLRYSGALAVSEVYRLAGFDAVVTDNIFGTFLGDFIDLAAPGPMYLVMLDPDAEAVEEREAGRDEVGYTSTVTVEALMDQVRNHTRRVGLWVDSTNMSPDETIAHVLDRLDEARVDVTSEPDATNPELPEPKGE